jgi:predicted MFS family arabinose efflux permease
MASQDIADLHDQIKISGMVTNLLEFGPVAFFYLLALAASVSGYTSATVALLLAGVGTLWLCGSLVYKGKKWHNRRIIAGKHGLEPSHLIVIGLVGGWLFLTITVVGIILQYMRPFTNLSNITEIQSKIGDLEDSFARYVEPRHLSQAQTDAILTICYNALLGKK